MKRAQHTIEPLRRLVAHWPTKAYLLVCVRAFYLARSFCLDLFVVQWYDLYRTQENANLSLTLNEQYLQYCAQKCWCLTSDWMHKWTYEQKQRLASKLVWRAKTDHSDEDSTSYTCAFAFVCTNHRRSVWLFLCAVFMFVYKVLPRVQHRNLVASPCESNKTLPVAHG